MPNGAALSHRAAQLATSCRSRGGNGLDRLAGGVVGFMDERLSRIQQSLEGASPGKWAVSRRESLGAAAP